MKREKYAIIKRNILPEYTFLILIFLFGLISTFITFPLTNGDEGYHLSKSYTIFSKNQPESMKKETLRNLELIAISPNKQSDTFDVTTFNSSKLTDVASDGIKFNLIRDDNSTLKVDIAHIIPAIGVLITRIIYPSYASRCSSYKFNFLYSMLLLYY